MKNINRLFHLNMKNISNNLQGALHAAISVIESVQIKGVGFATILKIYSEKCGINQIIDNFLHFDPR